MTAVESVTLLDKFLKQVQTQELRGTTDQTDSNRNLSLYAMGWRCISEKVH